MDKIDKPINQIKYLECILANLKPSGQPISNNPAIIKVSSINSIYPLVSDSRTL